MSNNPAKYEALIKQYLRSILMINRRFITQQRLQCVVQLTLSNGAI